MEHETNAKGKPALTKNQSQSDAEPGVVEKYIADQPVEIRAALTAVHKAIREAAPDATEKIAWGMPAFWQGEYLICFGGFKKHIGIYPGDMTGSPFEQRLAGYRWSKSTLQFPLDKPIDTQLIADITRWRVAGAKDKPQA